MYLAMLMGSFCFARGLVGRLIVLFFLAIWINRCFQF